MNIVQIETLEYHSFGRTTATSAVQNVTGSSRNGGLHWSCSFHNDWVLQSAHARDHVQYRFPKPVFTRPKHGSLNSKWIPLASSYDNIFQLLRRPERSILWRQAATKICPVPIHPSLSTSFGKMKALKMSIRDQRNIHCQVGILPETSF